MSYRVSLPIASVVLSALFGCGTAEDGNVEFGTASPNQDAIIQGAVCGPEAFPASFALLVDAAIEFGGFGSQEVRTLVCGGTLIAPDVVLTAAHCVDPEALTMGFGTVTRQAYFVTSEPGLTGLAEQQTSVFPDDTVSAVAWIKHPEFDLNAMNAVNGPGNYHDIGLVFLSAPLDRELAAVITAEEATALAVGTTVDIVGWGQQTAESSPFQPPPAGTVGQKMCAQSFINELGSHEMQIGAEGPRKCHGDSGGPSYVDLDGVSGPRRRVIGITSHAYDERDCEHGGVDTRVDAWLDWIDTEMRAGCTDGTRVWCDEPGILPPTHPLLNGGTAGPTDPTDVGYRRAKKDKNGCTQTGTLPVWALLGLGLVFVRPTQRRA